MLYVYHRAHRALSFRQIILHTAIRRIFHHGNHSGRGEHGQLAAAIRLRGHFLRNYQFGFKFHSNFHVVILRVLCMSIVFHIGVFGKRFSPKIV